MKDWYINSIEQKKRGNMESYKKTLIELFDKELSWSEVKELNDNDQIKLMVNLERNIKISKSIIDITKLARAIQNSRSGAGGCAITEFTCAFCNETDWWSSTAVPKICRKCAEEMATNFVLQNNQILKSPE